MKYATALGVDPKQLLFSQPDSGEHALNIADDLVDSGAVDLIVIDSVAALTPQAEIDGEMGAYHLGVHARLMSQACRKLAGTALKSDTTIFFINQIRHKIGVLFGSPETTTGGNALKFYASMRLDVRKREQTKDSEDNAQGNRTEVKIIKNKVAPPFGMAEFGIVWGVGIDQNADLLTVAVDLAVIEKAGAWYSYKGERIGQGFNKAVAELVAKPAMRAEVLKATREVMFK